MNTMKWLLKREFWENKGGFFWAPIIGGAVFIFINVAAALATYAAADRAHIQIGTLQLDRALSSVDPEIMAKAGAAIDFGMLMIAALVMVITAIVVFFYSISALYDERRDRSILFWKSLPLSDAETVLSKVLSATLVAPVIGMLAGIATAVLMLVFLGIYGAFFGQNLFGIAFSIAHPFKVALLIASTLPIAALWSLPTVGWLMLCSVWARSKPFLWAVAIPVAAGVMVSWFDVMRSFAIPDSWFWKHVVGRVLLSMMPGSWLSTDIPRLQTINGPEDISKLLSFSDVFATLGSMNLWIGVAAGIAMLVLAVRIRRWRDEA